LIQVTSNDQIEFCHQLIQEYYAAEHLLQMLLQEPSPLSDETLKREYLNYLKWTEPLALMLELVEDEKNKKQAVRVVRLALEVDLRLGARLAGAVKPKFQETTIDLVTILEISQQLKMLLLGITRSHIAIDILSQALEHRDSSVRWFTTEALGQIVSEATIPDLKRAIQDEDNWVRWAAFKALEKIGTDPAIHALCQALDNKDSIVRRDAVHWLGQVRRETGTKTVFPCLIQALEDEDSDVCGYASYVLEQIGIPELLPNLFEMELTAANNIYGIIETISVIQGRCKYYNHVIATSSPPQEENNAESLTADLQQYEEILSVISNMVTVMERNPKTFGGIEEEALRDHFLVQINGKDKGQATGETFNKKGKTDILIRVDGKNIFIAECKFWGGEKKLKETLDQLLGYTTWRDTKLALLIFNRNKNFSAVLEQISEVMKNHPTFTQELFYPSETGFRFILHHPEDKNRELLLTVLAFEIPR